MKVSVQITGDAQLRAELAILTGLRARRNLHVEMGRTVRELTREHLAALAGSKHTTAQKLGAAPSGHLAEAAQAVEAAPVTADSDAASFVINHPGLGRAFHDVTILPGPGKQFLALPMNALAYDRRLADAIKRGEPHQIVHRGDTVRTDLAAYILVRSVTQKQDRSLLPSDEAWEAAAEQGARNYFSTRRDSYGV